MLTSLSLLICIVVCSVCSTGACGGVFSAVAPLMCAFAFIMYSLWQWMKKIDLFCQALEMKGVMDEVYSDAAAISVM